MFFKKHERSQTMDYEAAARNSHRSGQNCAMAVYGAFRQVNGNSTSAPRPREEDGKCGAVLAAEKVMREMNIGDTAEFDKEFERLYGSLKCADLRGAATGKCNDYVGTAAKMVGELLAR